ncbi:MAG TPA: FkbM family methyltransferase [Solirubrobacterales bacterium]|nr:FkbM family methyltransferase [Solirubrobacterales bacterium]
MAGGGSTERLKSRAKRLLRRLDIHAGRHRNTLGGARAAILADDRLDLVIDVGAHAGEYGSALRADGYRGRIVSFEPVGSQFARLSAAAAGDDAWECRNRAAGGKAETATINISGNDGFSSSLLAMNEAHERAVGESRYQRSETIEVVSLDGELADFDRSRRHAYLKVDTQGFEHEVIRGGGGVLAGCLAVELELSLTPLYEGQLLVGEMIALMREHGFRPTHLEPEFVDPANGELLQLNGLFQAV